MTARHVRVAAVVAVVVLVLDQATKALVERTMTQNSTIPLLPFFALTYVRNTGAAFGLLAGLPAAVRLPLFATVTAVAAVTLWSYLRQLGAGESWVAAALGGILGGAAGNFVCRVRYGEVVDFLHLHYGRFDWPMFNVADSAITVGIVVVLAHSLRQRPASEAP